MGVTGSNMVAYLNWCPPEEHRYVPVDTTYRMENELLRRQLCTVQSDMKQLVNRMEHIEQTIATFTEQLAEMADTDMVVIRS
jgi:hypothetical protein